ncbi:MAG: hypothetical protein HQL32_00850 [Planctomycetes bacterium]|nr:hypothetical protein [Planctomycetota bacterium]
MVNKLTLLLVVFIAGGCALPQLGSKSTEKDAKPLVYQFSEDGELISPSSNDGKAAQVKPEDNLSLSKELEQRMTLELPDSHYSSLYNDPTQKSQPQVKKQPITRAQPGAVLNLGEEKIKIYGTKLGAVKAEDLEKLRQQEAKK